MITDGSPSPDTSVLQARRLTRIRKDPTRCIHRQRKLQAESYIGGRTGSVVGGGGGTAWVSVMVPPVPVAPVP
jgi:hypothetical protein